LIIYKWQPHNKLNGSLFYCFEYAHFLNTKLYIVNINDDDLSLITKIFEEKYTASPDIIVPITRINFFRLKLTKAVFLDIKSWYGLKEFVTGDIHVFANEPHEMASGATYYGSYEYQDYDVFNYLKINFNIFKPLNSGGTGTFVSGPFIPSEYKGDMYKKHDSGVGNIFELVDTLTYVHTSIDTNNRIIPEAFYYNKKIIIDDRVPTLIDSITLRYNDIMENGLGNYTLTEEDAIVKAINP
jgi:hypothetical protein